MVGWNQEVTREDISRAVKAPGRWPSFPMNGAFCTSSRASSWSTIRKGSAIRWACRATASK